MTEPEFRRVFTHPEEYVRAGQWLQALREARQMSMEEVGKLMGLGKASINQYETRSFLKNDSINNYLQVNPLGFPVDASGVVTQEAADLFERVISGRERMLNYQAWITLPDMLKKLGIAFPQQIKKNAPVIALINSIIEKTKPQVEEGIVPFIIDDYNFEAKRMFDGSLRIAPESIDTMRQCASIKKILADQAADIHPPPSRIL